MKGQSINFIVMKLHFDENLLILVSEFDVNLCYIV